MPGPLPLPCRPHPSEHCTSSSKASGEQQQPQSMSAPSSSACRCMRSCSGAEQSTAHHIIGWARTSTTTSHILRSRYPYPYPYPTHLRQPDPLLPEVSDPLLQHPSQLLLQLALRHDTAQTDRQTDRRELKTAASIPLHSPSKVEEGKFVTCPGR